MATHSSILAWEIPWTEEPGRLVPRVMDGETSYDANLTGPIAIVIGNEGRGVGRLVKEKCDFVLSIPMKGKINSLNASNAAAILMYGIRRARELNK